MHFLRSLDVIDIETKKHSFSHVMTLISSTFRPQVHETWLPLAITGLSLEYMEFIAVERGSKCT